MTESKFKYIVSGDHPIFKYIDHRCITLEEARNWRINLLNAAYENVKINEIKQ